MTNELVHPEFEVESERLRKTIGYIRRELGEVEAKAPIYGQKHELVGRHRFLSGKEGVLNDALRDTPYYARLDFQESGQIEVEEFYVSKLSGLQLQHGPVRVIHWASPMGGLYYQTSRAKVSYVAPQGEIHGDVYLRRQLLTSKGSLVKIIDEFDRRKKRHVTQHEVEVDEADVFNPDEYLRLVLEGKRGEKLTEVVTSIQERQNEIMRADPEQILLVQGPAGSGKTTIALHRVAILLYVPEGRPQKDPTRLMVIGANEFFLRFVSQVLPSLEINHVPQSTFIQWITNLTGIRAFHKFKDQTLIDVLEAKSEKQADTAYRMSKLKGSLHMIPWLERLSQQYRLRKRPDGLAIFPQGNGSLGMFYTIPEYELNRIIDETADEPINRQRDIVVGRVSEYLFVQHKQNYRAWTSRIAVLLNDHSQEIHKDLRDQWRNQLQYYGYRENGGIVEFPSSESGAFAITAENRRNRALRSLQEEIAKLVRAEFPRYLALDAYIEFLSGKKLLSYVLKVPSDKEIEKMKKMEDLAKKSNQVWKFEIYFFNLSMMRQS